MLFGWIVVDDRTHGELQPLGSRSIGKLPVVVKVAFELVSAEPQRFAGDRVPQGHRRIDGIGGLELCHDGGDLHQTPTEFVVHRCDLIVEFLEGRSMKSAFFLLVRDLQAPGDRKATNGNQDEQRA